VEMAKDYDRKQNANRNLKDLGTPVILLSEKMETRQKLEHVELL